MKVLLFFILGIFIGLIIVNIHFYNKHGGYAEITETEFKVLLDSYEVEDCPTKYQYSEPWLNSDKNLSIFKTSSGELLAKYYFLRGRYIPRKYSHLIDDKIKRDCNKKVEK